MEYKINPLISVILPTHNRPSNLKRALISIINQTYKKTEIIIVDDSTNKDDSKKNEEIVKSLKDKRTIYIKTEKNEGGSGSRNVGIRKSKGEYISFLDDDDEWLSEKLSKQLKLFNSSEIKNIGIVYCNYIIFDLTEKNLKGKKIKENKRGYIFKDLLNRMCVGVTSTWLVKRDVFKKVGLFDTKLKSAQDYDLPLRISEYYNFDFVDVYLVNKYEGKNRISTNYRNKLQGTRYFQKKHREKYKRLGIYLRIYNSFRFTSLKISYILGMIFGSRILKIQNKLVGLLR